jgi:hypothetical protein
MGFLKRLFGGGRATNPDPSTTSGTSSRSSPRPSNARLTERDNAGMRCETEGEGEGYFVSLFQKDPEPILFYFFDTKDKATQALAQVSCMAVAADSGKLICTDTLTFGVFPAVDRDDSRTWGALLAGKSLTHDLWTEARECFTRHGGRMRREDEPEKTTAPAKKGAGDASLVKFSHERRDVVAGAPATYRHHKAPDKASAIAWLQQHPVDKRSFFLVVETPEGTFARDIQGIFEG